MKNKTVAEFVAEDYRTSDIFYAYDIDFCCGGKKSISQVCKEKNIDADKLVNDLSNLKKSTDDVNFADLSATELINHIETHHHNYIRTHSPILIQYLNKIYKVHRDRHPELQELYTTFENLVHELEDHLLKEERILFPYIRLLEARKSLSDNPFSTVSQPITRLESEHEDAGDAIKKIRDITQDFTPPSDACSTYKIAFEKLKDFEQDLFKHVHLENNILFPKAILLERELS